MDKNLAYVGYTLRNFRRAKNEVVHALGLVEYSINDLATDAGPRAEEIARLQISPDSSPV